MMDEDQQRGRVAAEESRRARAVLDAHLARLDRVELRSIDGLVAFGVRRLAGVSPRVTPWGQHFAWEFLAANGGRIQTANAP